MSSGKIRNSNFFGQQISLSRFSRTLYSYKNYLHKSVFYKLNTVCRILIYEDSSYRNTRFGKIYSRKFVVQKNWSSLSFHWTYISRISKGTYPIGPLRKGNSEFGISYSG